MLKSPYTETLKNSRSRGNIYQKGESNKNLQYQIFFIDKKVREKNM